MGTPKGSIFVGAQIGPAKLSFDCQPGTTNLADVARFAPATATAFTSLAASGQAAGSQTTAGESGDGSSALPMVIAGVVVVAALAGGGLLLSRRRHAGPADSG